MIILKRIIFSPINKIKRCHIIVNNSSQKNKKKSYKKSIGIFVKTNLIIISHKFIEIFYTEHL